MKSTCFSPFYRNLRQFGVTLACIAATGLSTVILAAEPGTFAEPPLEMAVAGDLFTSEILVNQALGRKVTLEQWKQSGGFAPPNLQGDYAGPFGFLLRVPFRTKLTIEVTCESFIEPSSITAIVEKFDGTSPTILRPPIKWKMDRLYALAELEPAIFHCDFKDPNGNHTNRYDFIVLLHPVNECMLVKDSANLLAAYVNESDPLVEAIVQEAKEKKLVDKFMGANAPDLETMMKEISAIWTVLQGRGLRYSSMARTFASATIDKALTTSYKVQNVRLVGDTLTTRQANCVDGSVLFASVFEHMGLDATLWVFPGHCLVSVDAPALQQGLAVETTLLGSGATLLEASIAASDRIKGEQSRFESQVPGYYRVKIKQARATVEPLPTRASFTRKAP